MSELDELIQQYCPDGVRFYKIGELASYEQPGKYLVQNTNYDDSFPIPVLTAGQSFILGYTNETDGIYSASKESPVIIFDDFTGAFKWVDFPFKAKSSAMKMITANNELTTLRFLFHLMEYINFTSDEHKRLWIGTYSEIEVPLPPLPVQREIVRILDSFTEKTEQLKHELAAELVARREQFEYYRNMLLELNNASWATIDDVFDVRNGYTPSKKVKEYWENGSVPWMRLEDIRTKGTILDDSIQHVSETAVKKSGLFSKNSIMVSTTATLGVHALVTCDYLSNQQITNLTINNVYSERLLPKFVYFYFYQIDKKLEGIANFSGGIPIVDQKKFRKLAFPIPPIENQEIIVKQLETYEAIVDSLETSLPVEIEARQKQYEYYRDELLTFRRLSS